MDTNIKISIIVPAYNLEKYIKRCLMSILHQTYSNLEIIVVNDGSTDNTRVIIDEIAAIDSRIVPIHQKNKGVFFSRIEGIKKATGNWIGFVDGDDEIELNMYETLLKNAIENDADISHCGYKMIYPDRTEYFYNTQKKIIQDNRKGIKDLMMGTLVEPGLWNKLFKKSLLDSVLTKYADIFKNKYSINEDLLMNYFLFKNSKLSVFQDICLYHYILRKNSASKANINVVKLDDPLRVIRTIKDDYESNDEIKAIINERYTRQLISIVTTDVSNTSVSVKNYVKKTKKYFKKQIKSILKMNYNKKINILALWSCYSSSSYRFIHLLYEKAKGIDKKYKI